MSKVQPKTCVGARNHRWIVIGQDGEIVWQRCERCNLRKPLTMPRQTVKRRKCPLCENPMSRNGHTPNGDQKWLCKCGLSCTDGDRPVGRPKGKTNTPKTAQQLEAIEANRQKLDRLKSLRPI